MRAWAKESRCGFLNVTVAVGSGFGGSCRCCNLFDGAAGRSCRWVGRPAGVLAAVHARQSCGRFHLHLGRPSNRLTVAPVDRKAGDARVGGEDMTLQLQEGKLEDSSCGDAWISRQEQRSRYRGAFEYSKTCFPAIVRCLGKKLYPLLMENRLNVVTACTCRWFAFLCNPTRKFTSNFSKQPINLPVFW